MKTRTKNWMLVFAVFMFLLALGGMWLWFVNDFVHQHCIKQTGLAFSIYAEDHHGQLPSSTNGFGNALLLLTGPDPTNDYIGGFIGCLCGPGDDGHLYREALKNHSVLPEDQCTRVYIQGLSESNDPQICILFDRNSCRGGDHFRSPWGHRVREACLLDGSMVVVPDEKCSEFSRQQVDFLVAAGFSRVNALRFYPAATP